jgi:hypothetical protein
MISRWQSQIQWNKYYPIGNKKLLGISVVETSKGYFVGALTIPQQKDEQDIIKATNNIFDDHSHKIVGLFTTLTKAKKAGETYAKEFLASKKKPAKCGCKTIKTPRKHK